VAGVGLPPKLREFQAQHGAFVPPPGLPLARLIETKKVAHMLDDPERLSPASKLGGARSHIAVPMLKEGKVVGAIYIYRQEVKPFTDKQIELVQNSPPKPSSPSRVRGCSTNFASARWTSQRR
jgi:hypothetical protein